MLQASLKVIGGKNDGKVIAFNSRKFLVGREQDCHLRPNSDLVSRHHCVFTVDDYTLRLRDLGSTNGTLVNGRRIRGETVLMPGDVVRIGKLDLEVVIGSTAGASVLNPIANIETTSNASAMDTAFNMPVNATIDSDASTVAPASETVEFEAPMIPVEDLGSDDAIPTETDTVIAGLSANDTVTDQPLPGQQPTYPQQAPGYPPEGMPPGAWQFPPQYAQYPQYQQYMPPGYPMAYPPGYPPGYGYPPQQAPYPGGGYPQPGAAPPAPAKGSGSSAEIKLPDIRLPNPEDTGAKDVPKPAPAAPAEAGKPQTSTPSKSAEEMLSSSRRRRRDEEA